MDRRLLVLVLALAFSAALTASARADVLVAYDKFVSGQGFDIDVRNLQQDGAPVTLPAGVNTPANEFHPTLSGDGRLLAFERDTLATAGGPERPPVYNKQFVVVDLHAGRIVTPPAFQFSDPLRTTPSLSADGRWLVNGNSPFRDTAGSATLNDLASGAQTPLPDPLPLAPPACTGADICVGPGSEISIPPDAVPISGQTTSIINPAVGPGASPLVAWTRYRVSHLADGRTAADIALRLHRAGQEIEVRHGSDQVFGHPSVFGSNLVTFEAVPLSHTGVAGNGDIYASDGSGSISRTLPQVNSPADEREPAWTQDGRYLAFVRKGADGHQRVLLFDFANNLLVDPAGLDLGVPQPDARPLGESLALQGGISVAADPTARTETTFLLQPRAVCVPIKGATAQCTLSGTIVIPVKKTTVGILARRVLGTEKLFGRRVPRLGPQVRLPLGTHAGRFSFSRRLRGWHGRYELTLRTFDRHGHVRTLAAPRLVTVH